MEDKDQQLIPWGSRELSEVHGGGPVANPEASSDLIDPLAESPPYCPMCRRPFLTEFDADEPEDAHCGGRGGRYSLNASYFRGLHLPRITEGPAPAATSTQDVARTPPSPSRDSASQTTPTGSAPPPSPLEVHNAESIGYYEKYFVEVSCLGHGSFGGVYVCRHVMEGHSLGLFAVKKLPLGDRMDRLDEVLREVRVLEEVRRHPNVIEYKHSWIDVAQTADFGPSVKCLFILMEYATEGSLDTFLEKNGTILSTTAVWYFFLSAVCGVAHLHSKGILHRDLKPQNLLLTECEGKPPRLMVADFGTSTLQDMQELASRTGGTGTLEYMAPEVLKQRADGSGQYVSTHSKASDVWSLGVTLHYLAFEGELPSPIAPHKLVGKEDSNRPLEMIELIRAMLHHDPRKRPSCDDILRAAPVKRMMAAFEACDWAAAERIVRETSVARPPSPQSNSPRQTPPKAVMYDQAEEEVPPQLLPPAMDSDETSPRREVSRIPSTVDLRRPRPSTPQPSAKKQPASPLLPPDQLALSTASVNAPLSQQSSYRLPPGHQERRLQTNASPLPGQRSTSSTGQAASLPPEPKAKHQQSVFDGVVSFVSTGTVPVRWLVAAGAAALVGSMLVRK